MITAAQQALVPLLRAAESVLPAERLASTPGLRALGRVLLRWCVHALARRRGLDVDLRSIAAPVRESWSAELRECVDALDDLAWLDAACERELAERLADALAQAERSLDRLGLLHEQLLDVAARRDAQGWTLVRLAHARKRSGTFYTPPELARAMLDKALAPPLAHQLAHVRICDPAMGGGVFLLAALARLREAGHHDAREIVGRQLFGVDLDAHAVELARLVLWLALGDATLPCSFADANLRHGDALIGWLDAREADAADRACAAILEPERAPEQVRERWSPLHWSLAFPDVFGRELESPGFELVIGNPPWEIRKPSSREFFAAHDGEFLAHDKQTALARADTLLDADAELRAAWHDEHERRRAFARWTRHAYAHQGGGDPNSYKLFVERATSLVCEGGRLALLVPASIYADKGAAELRTRLLDACRWEWLYGFENAAGLFAIHRSFKFALLVAAKGGSTSEVRVAFMRRSVAELRDDDPPSLAYPRERVARLSPAVHAFVELDDARDVALLERIHAGAVRLDAWGARYRREFDMTLDSSRFVTRPACEARGLRPDEYGHWLAGDWRPLAAFGGERGRDIDASGRWSILARPPDLVLSRDGTHVLALADVRELWLPLYEGRMIDHYDFAAKGWVAGRGRAATWRAPVGADKQVEPQFLVDARAHVERREGTRLALGLMDVSAATNARTLIAALTHDRPHGNKVPILGLASEHAALELLVGLDALVLDFAARARLSGQTLNAFILAELPLLPPGRLPAQALELALALALPHVAFARVWLALGSRARGWRRQWLCDDASRRDARVLLDVLVADALALEHDELAWLLRGCEGTPYASDRHAKGFWRIDKSLAPEQRHPRRVLARHRDLCERGRAALLAELVSDEREPDAEREASWLECERHAALVDALVELARR